MRIPTYICIGIATLLPLITSPVYATDVQPRLYSNIPVGMQFISFAHARSRGEVAFDDSVPLEDVSGDIGTTLLSYSRGIDVNGKSGLLTVMVPYTDIALDGLYLGLPAQGQRQGMGDPKVRFALNLYGAPALRPEEFSSYRPSTIVGASITVGLPLGRYADDRVLNPGTNRWNVQGQAGFSTRVQKWEFEGSAGASWSSKNDEVLGDNELEQDAIGFFLGAMMYHFRPGVWLGVGLSYTFGGDTRLNGVKRNDHHDNWRTGVAYAFPIGRRSSMQLKWTDGVVSRIGADFETIMLSYTYSF